MDPADLGEPVRRPRIYFFGVRADVALASAEVLQQVVAKTWRRIKEATEQVPDVPLERRLLPPSHPALKQFQDFQKERWLKAFYVKITVSSMFLSCYCFVKHAKVLPKHCSLQAQALGFPDKKQDAKWRKLHGEISVQCKGPTAKHHVCSADDLWLRLPRERDAWKILSGRFQDSEHGFAVDLSQTVTRSAGRADGKLPTITPGSKLAMSKVARVLSPLEKIMLHGFPIHRMTFGSITDKELESMGGNTMHVHIVGAAALVGMGLVNWALPSVDGPGPRFTKRRSMVLVQSGKQITQKPKQKKHHLAKAWKVTLKKRFGLLSTTKKVAKRCAKIKRPQVLALRGTRWG